MYLFCLSFFFFNDTATTEIYTLSLHDALPISSSASLLKMEGATPFLMAADRADLPLMRLRSEEHTSELQSPYDLVCRLLLEKKKKKKINIKSSKTPIAIQTNENTY